MLKDHLQKIIAGKNLTREESGIAMHYIMEGQATPSQIAALLVALRMKGETIDEITGFATAMREHAVRIHPTAEHLVDTCGTGGDLSHTFNISTIAALVAAGAGVKIAKHGNRSVSSKCGSADVLEALGVKIELEPKKVEDCINEVGIGFIFAPKFHPAMKHAMPTRRELGIRTVFNILGPLTNPAGAQAQVLGVFDSQLTTAMAEVLKNLGSKEVMVVHGEDGLDEISLSASTKISHLKAGKIETFTLEPEELGLKRAKKEDFIAGTIGENTETVLEILEKAAKGPRREIVLLNAAAAIVVGGKAKTLKEGLKLAAESIDSGAALKKLEALKKFTNT